MIVLAGGVMLAAIAAMVIGAALLFDLRRAVRRQARPWWPDALLAGWIAATAILAALLAAEVVRLGELP